MLSGMWYDSWGGLVQGQNLESMILVGPFLPRIFWFYNSNFVILYTVVQTHECLLRVVSDTFHNSIAQYHENVLC